MNGQLTLDDIPPAPEPVDDRGLTRADREWRDAGCPIPVPYNVVPF